MINPEDDALTVFIQGYLYWVTKQEFPVMVDHIEHPSVVSADRNLAGGTTVKAHREDDGSFQHWFTIVTKSGLRIRVAVELEEET